MNGYRYGCRSGLLAVILLTVSASQTNALLYTLTDPGDLDASSEPHHGTKASTPNDNGEVVSPSLVQNQGFHGYYSSSTTGMVNLNPAGYVVTLSHSGQVAGRDFTMDNDTRATQRPTEEAPLNLRAFESQITEVREPGTMTLLGMGALMVLWRRRLQYRGGRPVAY